MPRIVREAELSWDGSLARGAGHLTAATSGAFEALPFSLPSRVADPEGKTSPEELLAAAHGACFTMSLGGELARAGATVEHLDVRCTITMDEVEGKGHEIVHSALVATVGGTGLDESVLAAAATAADEGCPFSRLLKAAGAGVDVTATVVG
jgi:lipoyl-dependent peroxiredoxin